MTTPVSTVLVLSWQPELADYREAIRAKDRLRRMPEIRAVIVAAGFLPLIAGVFTGQPLLLFLGAGAVIGALIGSAYDVGPGYVVAAKRVWRRQPTLQRPVTVRIGREEGVESVVEGASGWCAWSQWAGFVETDRTFILLTGRRTSSMFMVLAKRGAKSPEEISLLRDLLAAETDGVMAKARGRS